MKILLVILTLFLSACTSVTQEALKQCRNELHQERLTHIREIENIQRKLSYIKNSKQEKDKAVAMFEYCTTLPNPKMALLCDKESSMLGQSFIKEGVHRSNIYYKLYLFGLTALILLTPMTLAVYLFLIFFDRVFAFFSLKLKLSKLEEEARNHQQTINKAKKLEAEFEATQIAMNADLEFIERDTENAAALLESYEENIESLKAQKQQLEEDVSELERKKSSAEDALKISDF